MSNPRDPEYVPTKQRSEIERAQLYGHYERYADPRTPEQVAADERRFAEECLAGALERHEWVPEWIQGMLGVDRYGKPKSATHDWSELEGDGEGDPMTHKNIFGAGAFDGNADQ